MAHLNECHELVEMVHASFLAFSLLTNLTHQSQLKEQLNEQEEEDDYDEDEDELLDEEDED